MSAAVLRSAASPRAGAPPATPPATPSPGLTEAPPAGIEARGVSVDLGQSRVLDDFTLRAERGEIVALLGPSGAGKSTALRAIAGLVPVAAGSVLLGGVDVTRTPVRRRGVGMVVQSYALFPHLTVAKNVAFGLGRSATRAGRAAAAARVEEVLAMVGMAGHADRLPRQLSGGQQQRVAIARALAPAPDVLLLDEPLSALDAQLRQGMLAELARVHRELPDLTMLYVTHGQNEALTIADRVAVMADARLVELGPTRELYRRPTRQFTAAFLGNANLLPVEVVGPRAARVSPTAVLRLDTEGRSAGAPACVCLRPHRLHLAPERETYENEADLLVTDVQWRGSTHVVSGTAWGVEGLHLEDLELRRVPVVGQTVRVGFEGEDAILLDAEEVRA